MVNSILQKYLFACVCLGITIINTNAASDHIKIEKGILLAGAQQNQQFNLTNPVNQQKYLIQVFQPQVATPKQGFPVVYLLDGNAAFPYASVIAQSIEFSYARNKQVPPVIVAIGYPINSTIDVKSRTFDYTPPFDGEFKPLANRPISPYPQGGAEQFFQFIQTQLKPIISKHYSINDQQQTLFGHSYGGLFSLYTLFNHPNAFQHYVAASPSIWWNDYNILQHAQHFSQQSTAHDLSKTLTLTIGELELKENPSTNDLAKPSDIEQLAKQLQSVPNLSINTAKFANTNHFQAMFPAINYIFRQD